MTSRSHPHAKHDADRKFLARVARASREQLGRMYAEHKKADPWKRAVIERAIERSAALEEVTHEGSIKGRTEGTRQ